MRTIKVKQVRYRVTITTPENTVHYFEDGDGAVWTTPYRAIATEKADLLSQVSSWNTHKVESVTEQDWMYPKKVNQS